MKPINIDELCYCFECRLVFEHANRCPGCTQTGTVLTLALLCGKWAVKVPDAQPGAPQAKVIPFYRPVRREYGFRTASKSPV
jgi:hypothetical protein